MVEDQEDRDQLDEQIREGAKKLREEEGDSDQESQWCDHSDF